MLTEAGERAASQGKRNSELPFIAPRGLTDLKSYLFATKVINQTLNHWKLHKRFTLDFMVKSVSHEKYHSAVWRPGNSIFFLLFSLSNCAVGEVVKLFAISLSTLGGWSHRQKLRSRKCSSAGGEKSMVTHPFPTSNAPNQPVPDVETGRRGRRAGGFAHQILLCWWKNVAVSEF